MSLGNREGRTNVETKSEYPTCGLYKELRITATSFSDDQSLLSCTAVQVRRFFMNSKKTIIVLVVLAILVCTAAACWLIFRPETTQGSKTITVTVTHKNGDTNEFIIHTDAEYLRGALEEKDLVQGEESQYGLYILTVDSETVDETNQEWWGYTQDSEDVFYGIDSCPIEDGDHFEFSFHVGW